MVKYCVKCKSKTETINPKYKMSKNQKPMVQGKCVKCSKLKSQFISAAEAKKKKGGFIFTVPAVLGAVGALSGLASGASAIATAVNKKKSDDKMLAETKRHHVTMEKKIQNGGRSILETLQKISIPNEALSSHQLYAFIKDLKIKNFRGIFMRNGLPKRSLKTECGILNLDVEKGSGTHWTCWYKLDSTHCYYFDSYGLTSPSWFDDYIKMDIQVSPYNIQRDHPNICGHLCLIFLYECVIKKEPGLNTVLKLNQFFSYKNVRS